MPVPTEMQGEIYLTSVEAAELLNYSREWFEKSVVPRYNLKRYQKGVRTRPILYKKSDIEALAGIRPMEEPPEK